MPLSASIDDISEFIMAIQLNFLSIEKSYTVKTNKMTFIFYLFKNNPKSILLDLLEGKKCLGYLIGVASNAEDS